MDVTAFALLYPSFCVSVCGQGRARVMYLTILLIPVNKQTHFISFSRVKIKLQRSRSLLACLDATLWYTSNFEEV